MLGHQGDVDDADRVGPMDVEPARGAAIDLDDIERRPRVVGRVGVMLGLELLSEEGLLGGLVPRHLSQLLLPGAGVEGEQDLAIAVGERAQRYQRGGRWSHPRGANIPCRAMQKYSVR